MSGTFQTSRKAFPLGEGLILVDDSDRTLILDAQGAALWHAVEAGLSVDEIALALNTDAKKDPAQLRDDIAAVIDQWHVPSEETTEDLSALSTEPHWVQSWRCQFRDAVAEVAVERREHADIISRWIGHFPPVRANADARIEVRDLGKGYTMTFLNGRDYGHGQGIRQAVRALVELTWPEVPLCAMTHAGAVAGKQGAAMLTGTSGSGKSTLIGRLVSQGYAYLSDDLTPVSTAGELVPWPMPLSVKAGSWALLSPHFPGLGDAPSFAAKDTQARLLPLDSKAWQTGPQPTKAILFPRYRPGDTPPPERVSPLEALQELITAGFRIEAPVTDARAEALISWLENTPAYRLPFGDLEQAAAYARDLIGEP